MLLFFALSSFFLLILVSLFFFFFFFSSRRRHTRYIGDWSSDVCSSDLFAPRRLELLEATAIASGLGELVEPPLGIFDLIARGKVDRRVIRDIDHLRSEERRVGKECRCRWSRYA